MTTDVTDTELDELIDEGNLELDEALETSETPATPTADTTGAGQADLMKLFGKIPVQVTLEVASVELTLNDLREVDRASVIALDKAAGEPLDVKVNGALFAKAEVVVMNGNYGLRIVELSGVNLEDFKV